MSRACRTCRGEGIIKARTAMFEQTAVCGRCDGDGRDPERPEPPKATFLERLSLELTGEA